MYFVILDFDSFKGTKIIVLKVYQDKSLVHDDDPVQYFKQLHLFAFFKTFQNLNTMITQNC